MSEEAVSQGAGGAGAHGDDGPERELRSPVDPAEPQTAGGPASETTGIGTHGDIPTATGIADGKAPALAGSMGIATEGRFGRYELRGLLGRGGMGVVHLAWDPKLRREVALKTLMLGAQQDLVAIGRFLREARTAAALQHPGIVAIHEIGEEEGVPYFAMAYIRGATLSEAIAAGRYPLIRDRVQALSEVTEAVAYAHGAGVVHRDLKPANILVDERGGLRILDFGLAKKIGEGTQLTVSGHTQGTPHYMPPEQIEGDLERIGPHSDVYALGAMLYMFLAGHPPFEAASVTELLAKTLTADPRPPRTWEPRVPADLETVCLKALAKRPADRYPSAREFGAELSRWLRGEAILSRPPTVGERVSRWVSRRKAVVVPVAVALALAGAAGLWGWQQSVGEARARALAAAERARAEANRRAILGRIRDSVLGYEDTVMRLEMSMDVRRKLATQSLEMIDELIAQDPEFGPAYSWRGRVHALAGRGAEAEADFDQGCARAADSAVAWFLRGMHRLEAYERERPLPAWRVSDAERRRDAPPIETPRQEALRKDGLGDLDRMAGLADRDLLLRKDLVSIGEAMAALRIGGDARYESVLRTLRGVDGPKAQRMRGLALYSLGRFAEARDTLADAARQWPCDPLSRRYHGKAIQVLGAANGLPETSSMECTLAAITELNEAIRLDPTSAPSYNDRGVALYDLAKAHDATETRHLLLFRSIADFDESLRLDPQGLLPFNNRGLVWGEMAEVERRGGRDFRYAVDRCRADYTEAIRRDERYSLALANRAHFECEVVDYAPVSDPVRRATFDAALADVERAAALEPDALTHRVVRAGIMYLRSQRGSSAAEDPLPWVTRALTEYEEILRVAPTLATARLGRARSLNRLGVVREERGEDPQQAYAGAAEAFAECARAAPDEFGHHIEGAQVLLKLGRAQRARGGDPRAALRSAIAEFTEALRIRPDDWEDARRLRADACADLAPILQECGENPCDVWRMAIADRSERVRRAPHAISTWGQRGDALLDLGRVQGVWEEDGRETLRRALADYEEAGRVDPKDPMPLDQCAYTLAILAQVEESHGDDPRATLRRGIDVLEDLLRVRPGDPRWTRGLAGQRLALGKVLRRRKEDAYEPYRLAAEEFERICGPDPANAVNVLGLAEANEGLAEAEDDRGMDPRAAFARALRAREWLAQRNPGDADALYRLGMVRYRGVQECEARNEECAGEARRAEEELRAAAARGSTDALQPLAVLCINAERYDEAIQNLNALAAANPRMLGWVDQMLAAIAARRK